MKFKNISENLINKIPKILLILVVFFGLSLNRNLLFGDQIYGKVGISTEKLQNLAEKLHSQKVVLETDDDITYTIKDESKTATLGSVISSHKFSEDIRGYAGKTPIAIFVDKNMKIVSVELLENNETRSFVNSLRKKGFFGSWNDKKIGENIKSPDAVSGATFTSSAVIANFDAVYQHVAQKDPESIKIDWAALMPQIAILAVVILSLVCFFFPGKTRKLRIPVLVLSIGVLGFWQGAFVSIDLLYKWLLNGVSFTDRFALVLIVSLAMLIPLVFSRSWYCMYLCPFGALQELIGKLNKKKLTIPQNILTIFSWVRQIVLVTIVALLYFIPNFEPSGVEPFTIFMIKSAAISVIVIASASLIASAFIQKPWCRLLCPTGELMSILQRKFKINRNKK